MAVHPYWAALECSVKLKRTGPYLCLAGIGMHYRVQHQRAVALLHQVHATGEITVTADCVSIVSAVDGGKI